MYNPLALIHMPAYLEKKMAFGVFTYYNIYVLITLCCSFFGLFVHHKSMATIRVKIVKDYKEYKKGQVVALSPNEAFGLIDAGYGVVSKDMQSSDYHTGTATNVRQKGSKRVTKDSD